MYINSINICNIGPIDKCTIQSKFDENGNPYPIVIIGDNGKGKTILSSYIADAMIELAKSNSTYSNIVEQEGAYYKIVGQTNVKNGKEYGTGYEKGGDCQYGIKCHCIGNEFSVRRICAN